jgi:Antibiotic biosynthesis monooxygenase
MITFVNMFTVKTGQQDTAFAGIQQIYTEVVKFQAGFISATLLKSDDGNTVTAFTKCL